MASLKRGERHAALDSSSTARVDAGVEAGCRAPLQFMVARARAFNKYTSVSSHPLRGFATSGSDSIGRPSARKANGHPLLISERD
jgi:hypothetical protein